MKYSKKQLLISASFIVFAVFVYFFHPEPKWTNLFIILILTALVFYAGFEIYSKTNNGSVTSNEVNHNKISVPIIIIYLLSLITMITCLIYFINKL